MLELLEKVILPEIKWNNNCEKKSKVQSSGDNY